MLHFYFLSGIKDRGFSPILQTLVVKTGIFAENAHFENVSLHFRAYLFYKDAILQPCDVFGRWGQAALLEAGCGAVSHS